MGPIAIVPDEPHHPAARRQFRRGADETRARPRLDRSRCRSLLRYRGHGRAGARDHRGLSQRGVGRERVLIKIAATWEGIQAAAILQKEGIDCQSDADFLARAGGGCAEAGAYLISPFVGRILDWHVKNERQDLHGRDRPRRALGQADLRLLRRPMAKNDGDGRVVPQQGEIEALAGCDSLTIAPALLDKLGEGPGAL